VIGQGKNRFMDPWEAISALNAEIHIPMTLGDFTLLVQNISIHWRISKLIYFINVIKHSIACAKNN
jgi:hypothetical protein